MFCPYSEGAGGDRTKPDDLDSPKGYSIPNYIMQKTKQNKTKQKKNIKKLRGVVCCSGVGWALVGEQLLCASLAL